MRAYFLPDYKKRIHNICANNLHIKPFMGVHGYLPYYRFEQYELPGYVLAYIFDVSVELMNSILANKQCGDDVTELLMDLHYIFFEFELSRDSVSISEFKRSLSKLRRDSQRIIDLSVTDKDLSIKQASTKNTSLNKRFYFYGCLCPVRIIAVIVGMKAVSLDQRIRSYKLKEGSDLTPLFDKTYLFRGDYYTIEHLTSWIKLRREDVVKKIKRKKYGEDITPEINELLRLKRAQ